MPVPSAPARYVRGIEFRADNPQVLHHANVGARSAALGRRLDRADAGPASRRCPRAGAGRVRLVAGQGAGDGAGRHGVGARRGQRPRGAAAHGAGRDGADRAAAGRPVLLDDAADARADRRQARVESDRHSRRRRRLRRRGQLHAAGGRRSGERLSARALSGDADGGTATLPDGRVTPLLSIPRWNIRWQDQYRYRTPVVLPRGTTLRMRFVYDNSAANPNNRFQPPRRVQWGPLSTDEMGALWLEVVPRHPRTPRCSSAIIRSAR